MNIKVSLVAGVLLLLSFSTAAIAQPKVEVANVVVPASATAVDVNVVFTPAAANTNAGQFDIVFDKLKLAADVATTCPALWICTQRVNGVRYVSPFVPGGGLAGFSINVSFDLTSADSDTTYPLTVSGELYTDVNSQALPAVGTTNGSIEIQPPVPDADFNPNAGLLDLGSAPQSTITGTSIFIDNVGPTGSFLNASCSITNNGSVFSVVNGTVTNLSASDPAQEVTVNCTSPTIATHNGEMTCTHDGDGTTDGSPQVYPLTCVMTEGPTPQYGSTPAPGGTVDFGNPVKDTTPVPMSVFIHNDNGDDGTTLSSTGCTLANNPNGAYSITGGSGAFSVPKGDPDHEVTLECNTAIAGNHDGGILSCQHNGSNTTDPATYTLNCQVDPVPVFASNAPVAITPASIPQNNTPLPVGGVEIYNDGDPGSNLSGSCSLVNVIGGAIEFTTGSGGAYSLAKDATKNIGVQCNSSAAPGLHSATVSCDENDPNYEGPFLQEFSCTVNQPDPGTYDSNPSPGQGIDITDGTAVVEGSPNPTKMLSIFNSGSAGDSDIVVTCYENDDVGTAISATPVVDQVLSPGGPSFDVTFTCDTTTANPVPYQMTFGCDYEPVLVPAFDDELESQQSYTGGQHTVTCEVREGAADVSVDPPSGTTLMGELEPGGTASLFVTFSEILDEELAGTLVECSLDSGADFSIVSPGSFPQDIPAGESLQVEVQGTDPGGVDSISDVLTCVFTDTDSDLEEVSWPLLLTIGGNAEFTVLKDFTDDNPGSVTVDLDCNTGLILDQEKVITENGVGVTFVVASFDSGELNCNVTERDVDGYSADYESSGDSDTTDSDDDKDGCYYTEVDGGDHNVCVITNDPDEVPVIITKEWVYTGTADNSQIPDEFRLVLYCRNASIVGGSKMLSMGTVEDTQVVIDSCAYGGPYMDGPLIELEMQFCKTLDGSGNTVFNELVKPYSYPGGVCYAMEKNVDPTVEVDNGCKGEGQGLYSLEVSAGSGDSCTITNTVFFEGIPTLSQYGMALLALLMLGMGFVAVRRIA